MTDTAPFTNVRLAFQWLNAYFEEVTKLWMAVDAAFVDRRYQSTTGNSIEFASSKSLARPVAWLPWYQYRFFARDPDAWDGLEGAEPSLLGICITSFREERPTAGDHPEVTLVRFTHPDGKPESRKGEIVYHWRGDGADKEEGGWNVGRWEKHQMSYSYKHFPLRRVESLGQVDALLVEPLVQHDLVSSGLAGD
jgi:hypothetical protein